jgi:hypothetical protein
MLIDNGARSEEIDSQMSPRFSHRPLDNGSVESICLNCFLTISCSWGDFRLTAEELNEIESAHECDPRHKPINPRDSN